MSTPRIKEPNKKTFHFPKSAKEAAPEVTKPSPKTRKASASTKVEVAVEASKAAKPEKTAKAPKLAKSATTAKAPKPAKSATTATAPTEAKPAKAPKTAAEVEGKVRRAKQEKEKVVRDSFTMPKSDYAKLAELKQRCLEAGIPVKKSELLRAGLNLLALAPAKRLIAAVSELETVKTGRPTKS
jgi:hypothetical protein